MAVEGTLDVFQLPEILQVIAHQRKTGILTVQGQNDIIAVSFLTGQVVAADALNQTMEDGLGEVLAQENLMRREQFADIAGRHREGGGPLNDLLVSGGHLTRAQLLASLRTQIIQLLSQLLAWREGEFKFYGGDEVSFEDGFRPISVEEVLLYSLRKRDDEVSLPTDRDRFRRLEPSKPINIRPMESPGMSAGGGGQPQEDPRFLWINPAERAVLDHVNASRSVREVADAAGIDSDQARYLLFRLEEMALVESLGEAPSSRPREVASAAASAGQEPNIAVADSSPPPGAAESFDSQDLDKGTEQSAELWTQSEEIPPFDARPNLDDSRARGDGELDAVPRTKRRAFAVSKLDVPIAWLAALAMIVGVVWALLSQPLAVLLPGSWHESDREALISDLRTSQLLKIDRAAKTHYLIHGSFPQDLQRLVDLGVLAPTEVFDADGTALELTPADIGYMVDVVDPQAGEDNQLVAEAVTDNFLLDPSFAPPLEDEQGPPLVLLD